jgi:hypothetical protein
MAVVLSCHQQPPPPPPPFASGSHDSPIDVNGGSIHISDNDPAGIVPCPPDNQVLCAFSNYPTVLSFTGVAGYQLPPTVTGWEITLSNKDKNNPRYPNAITLCTDINCSLAPPQNKTIYIKVRGDSKWLIPPSTTAAKPKEVDFHDYTHCTKDPGAEDPDCDHLVDVTLKFAGVSYPGGVAPALSCNNGTAGHCNIHIGK